jgi:putative transposase
MITQPIHPIALFRLSVLGPLASRDQFERGELKKIIQDLASKTYRIPGSKRTHLSPQIIERWYYLWLKGGIDALTPKIRKDKHQTHLSESIQTALLAFKKDNLARSLNTLILMLEKKGVVAKGELSRATVHRFLQRHDLSKRTVADHSTIERRSFVALNAGDIWQGDVLHGPKIHTSEGLKKTYLVSFLDDASRLITHSAFCLGETALDVEGVLKEAILKRGLPKKIILDNGAAYRAESLQGICARLKIRLIYCPAREPEGKGKLERYHRTFRELFLNELNIKAIANLEDINSRLWVWVENVYHKRPHAGLENSITPIERFRQDLVNIRWLPPIQHKEIDDLFYHRVSRFVRKDGTVLWEGKFFEVPYEFSGKTINLVVDPHAKIAIRAESVSGENLGGVALLDSAKNLSRKRQRPIIQTNTQSEERIYDAIEMAYEDHKRLIDLFTQEDN